MPELRTETVFFLLRGDTPTGQGLRSSGCPQEASALRHVLLYLKAYPKVSHVGRQLGPLHPGGGGAGSSMAWGAGLSLEAWPGALRGAGIHFLGPYTQESHPLLHAEAVRVGRLRVGGPEVLGTTVVFLL